MNDILVITAANKKFKNMCDVLVRSLVDLRQKYHVYDLGDLGYGEPFDGDVFEEEGRKIPSKPFMIKDALNKVNKDEYVVWMDAVTILWQNLHGIQGNYDIGVTVRGVKFFEDQPINAGVMFFKKTSATLKFVDKWIERMTKVDGTKQGRSDQREMNRFLRGKLPTNWTNEIVTIHDTQFKLFDCKIYNNWRFKKPQLHAKITHYKSSYRYHWPKRTIARGPKQEPRFTDLV